MNVLARAVLYLVKPVLGGVDISRSMMLIQVHKKLTKRPSKHVLVRMNLAAQKQLDPLLML